MKQKTFIFNAYNLGTFNKDTYEVNWDATSANIVIDEFIKDKDVISISTNCICRGNNPPNYGLVYVIVYNTKKGRK